MRVSEEVVNERLQSRVKLGKSLPGGLVTGFATLLFFSFYWNQFAGLRSGNGSFQGGMALLQRRLPYRDFFTAGPPLNEVISALVLAIFGQQLAVIRAWGVFERVALACLLYSCLIRVFRTRDAAFVSILAIIVSNGDPSNSLSSYAYEAIFFFLLSAWAVMRASEADRSLRALCGWAVAAGLFASLSFATKQTLGAGATIGVPLVAFVYLAYMSPSRTNGFQRGIAFVGAFIGGWCLGTGAVLLWLAQVGVLHEFFQDVFKKGPSAKASRPGDFVVRAVRAAWAVRYGFLGACVSLALCGRAMARGVTRLARQTETTGGALSVGLLAVLAIATGAAVSFLGKWPLQNFDQFAIYLSFFGCGWVVVLCAWRLSRGIVSAPELQIGFLAAIAFGIALMVSLSWPASYDMVFPGCAVVAGVILNGSGQKQRITVYAVGCVMIFAMTCEKLNLPQGFHEWEEPPVRSAKVHSLLPALRGMTLPPATVRFIDETARIVREHTGPSDTIFVYPEFGILYPLYDRRYPTATDSHNIDVVNDEFARSEAQRLLAAKPAVLIYYPAPEWSLRADERLWRHGERSGQRDLIAAIEKLASTYRQVESFDVPPNEGSVKVYVRE